MKLLATIIDSGPDTVWWRALALAGVSTAVLLLGRLINPVFLAAIFVMLAGVVLAYFRPFTGFLCYLVAIQVVDYFKRLLLAFGNPSLIEWYGILLLPDLVLFAVLVGVLAAGERRSAERARGRKYLAVASGLCLYAGWYTVRTVWTAAPMVNTVGKWKLVVPYFICFYIGQRLLVSKGALCSMLKVLGVSIGAAALYGLYQFFFGLTSFEHRWLFEGYTSLDTSTLLYGEGVPRAFSFYSDADTFASTLACIGTLLLFSRRMFGRWWWNSLALLGLIGGGLAATVVRAGWLHAFFGGVAYFWTQSRARTVRKIVVLLGLVGFLVAAGWWAISSAAGLDIPFLARAVTLGTYNARTTGYRNMLEMGIAGFIAGEGVATMPGSVKDLSGGRADEGFVGHDLISDLLYELGWIGLGLFMFVIVRTLTGRSPDFLGEMGPALKYIVWSIPVIAALFGGSLLVVRPVTTLLWASAGMLCVSDMKGERERT